MTKARSWRSATRRLGLGKRERALDRSAALGPKGLLDRLFVHHGGFDPDLDTGGREQLRPRRTG